MDPLSEKKLALVNPELAALVRKLDADYQQKHPGDRLIVQQGLRSFEQQAAIYAQGRTAPGEIVTHAPPGHSWHEFGMAIDVCPKSLLSVRNWDPENPIWSELAITGRSLGLFPGAYYVHVPPDRPHFQLTGSLPVSPDDATREAYAKGGLPYVWADANLEQEAT